MLPSLRRSDLIDLWKNLVFCILTFQPHFFIHYYYTRRLPGPIYHYIDGAAEDETTYQRNTEAFQDIDLIPNVLAGVENIDMSVEVRGYKLGLPIFCSPTALQRLFHHQGERLSLIHI